MKLKRIYHNYTTWEDYKHGMYDNAPHNHEKVLIYRAINILSDENRCRKAMVSVINNWRFSCEQFLTNINRNRKAWLGQAACCYTFRVPEHLTKLAWWKLTKNQQRKANKIAGKTIKEWEMRNGNFIQLLFKFKWK